MARFLVIPNDPPLLRELSGYAVVPTVESLGTARPTADAVRGAGTHLHCLRVETKLPLSVLSFDEELRGIPIALCAPSLGHGLASLLRQLPIVRRLDLRVYLPATSHENLSAVRILASLGIETALDLRRHDGDWEAVSDLMTYALLNSVAHAGIAPFNYLAARYDRHHRNDYGAVFFDDPTTYLHIDSDLNVALTGADLAAGRYAGTGRKCIDEIEQNDTYLAWWHAWREFFLRGDGCAYCAGWRVCLGKFEASAHDNPGCAKFAAEFMDSVEQAAAKAPAAVSIWQP
jgi:hypothetical protein